ncbi:MAG: alanine racemase [Gammaproteobacteria bacterium]|nr:alanine racemase [Gammaproteobacteria bacterium]
MPIPDTPSRPEALPDDAVLQVDLAALAANYRLLRQLAAPGRCGAVVKADAYGLGIAPVATRLRDEGCTAFFVATTAEGIELRALLSDPALAIHVLHGPAIGAESLFVTHRLEPVLNSLGQVQRWAALSRLLGRPLPCMLNLDTGMQRLGLDGDDLSRLRADSKLLRALAISHVMTHLARADEPDQPSNRRQLELFDGWRAQLPAAPISIGNSAGILLGPRYRGDLVRPGIALYGGNPRLTAADAGLRPVIRLDAPILQVREVTSAGTVGYGGTDAVQPPGRLATIGIGYADGYPRALSNRGRVIIAGRHYPIAGRVSMDLTTLDVSAAPAGTIRAGMRATLIGDDLTLDVVARNADMVSYEVLTRLGKRLRRDYHGA